MDLLLKLVRSATPASGIQFRRRAYGHSGIRAFLRDVLAMANASVDGKRYIVVGIDFDDAGRKRAHDVEGDDFSGNLPYQSLANEYIEPPIRIGYKPLQLDGRRVGVFEIGDCQDRPYMLRADFDERLRRGDAYMRVNDAAVKMGRRQLQELFERKFRDSVSSADIEVGFPGEIIHKAMTLPTRDLSQLPSALASKKLEELLRIRNKSHRSGSSTMVARLAHARLYGAEDPYEHRSPEEILIELSQLRTKYRHQDAHFLFEERAQPLQLVVYNQGREAIVDASLTLTLPNHDDFFVADRPPKRMLNRRFVDRSPDEIAAYPTVSRKEDAIRIMTKIGDIDPGAPVQVFAAAPLLCIDSQLKGRRFGIRYALHGQNLRAAARGQLKLGFS